MTTSAAFRAYTTSAAAYEAAAALDAWLRAAPSQAAFDTAKPAIDAAWAHAEELELAEYASANPAPPQGGHFTKEKRHES